MKALENNANLAEIESRLNKYPYLSKNNLPGQLDARVFLILQSTKRFPDRKVNPNFYHWYILMKQFSQTTISKWINEELYHDNEDSLLHEFIKLYSAKKENMSESMELNGSQGRSNKPQSAGQVQYAIDITLKDYNAQKINNLRKLLDDYKAEMTEDENNSKYIRILCRIDPANLDEFSGKISKCVEFNELSLRKKDMKGQKTNITLSQQKAQ